uniref:Uncharacterized protein n=1 Tax=Klebsiella pneumoniae TaxID=573 RepID=A0A2P1BNF6_KLEPN|nr:hypothetical protein [Klebsiella pneumoniae]
MVISRRGAGCVCPDSGSFRRDFLTTITGLFSVIRDSGAVLSPSDYIIIPCFCYELCIRNVLFSGFQMRGVRNYQAVGLWFAYFRTQAAWCT